VSHKRWLVLAGNLNVGKPMLCCFFYRTQNRFTNEKHLF